MFFENMVARAVIEIDWALESREEGQLTSLGSLGSPGGSEAESEF